MITWADLEKQFHKYFFFGVHEKKITDLVKLKQHNDESVESFVQRIREVKNKCYSLRSAASRFSFPGFVATHEGQVCVSRV